MSFALSTGFILFDILLALLAVFLAIFAYFKHSYQYWKNKGIPYLEPKFPFGNNTYLFPKTPTYGGEAKIWYDQLKAKGHKFGGAWSFSRKVLVLVHPDYIRDVLTQDFNSFADRDFYSNEKKDPLGTHLFNVKNPNWKSLRQKLTSTFTCGKMKMMFETVLNTSNFMINHLEKMAKTGDDIVIREVLAAFTTDVIGSVAFGIDCNSFDNTHAEFRREGKIMFSMDVSSYITTFVSKNFPELARFLGIKFGKQRSKDFFAKIIRETMEYRNKNNIVRSDFLQLVINLNNESKEPEKALSFEQIVANAMLFFIAGFDTSSTVMTFTLYELARNPILQEKVRVEILKVLEKHDGKLSYYTLQELGYLQMVLDETLRLYPPGLTLARICTQDYQLRDTDIILEKGTSVVITPFGLGRDEEYFPDPERFDPERFSPENKAKRHPFLHVPFGEGPRNCIGLRFGLMQSKIGLIRILTNFKLSVSPKTKMPVTLDPTLFFLRENEPIYLKAERIHTF